MKPALQKLLPHIEDNEENIFTFPFLKNILSEEEIDSLEKNGTLIKVRDLEKTSCESCVSGEFVDVKISERGRIYYTCDSDGSRQYIDPKKLRQWKFNNKYLPKKDSVPIKRLIEKDEHGNFYYNGKPISLSRTSEYWKLFGILYCHTNQKGFISYAAIEKFLVEKRLDPVTEEEKRNKRIQNLIHQGIFRYAKVDGSILKNETLSDQKLIDIERGKGIVFNNPTM